MQCRFAWTSGSQETLSRAGADGSWNDSISRTRVNSLVLRGDPASGCRYRRTALGQVRRRRQGGKIIAVSTKDRLHKLVDELSEQEANDALLYIAQRHEDPMIAAFRDAAADDEPVTAADEEALAEVQADRAAGVPRISYAEIMRKHG
jgi:hypothetical protein